MSTRNSSTKTVRIMVKIITYTVMIMLLLVLGVKGFGFGQAVFSEQGTQESPGKDISVSIPKGAGESVVTDILQDNGLIGKNTSVFRIQCLIYEAEFNEGTYTLNTSSSPEDIIEALKIKPVTDETDTVEEDS